MEAIMENVAKDLNAHPDFFIPFDARLPDDTYYDHVTELLPSVWRMKQDYFWTYVHPRETNTLIQGWKIHVSTLPERALQTLEKVLAICVKEETEFKFASDPKILRQLLSKNCSRSSSGKFITIYPQSNEKFKSLLDQLYIALKEEQGPYILSDRQYRDSKVIYFRYGGFKSLSGQDVMGEKTSYILDNRHGYIEDKRQASFYLPDFIKPEFQRLFDDEEIGITSNNENSESSTSNGYFNQIYDVNAVIKASNAGGVYLADDIESKQTVLIKEARPYIGISDDGYDVISQLQKEYRLLKKIEPLNIAPKVYSLFDEWEHKFLAQELIEGLTLKNFQAKINKITHSKATTEDVQSWMRILVKVAANILDCVNKLHQEKIVFGDISPHNIMVNEETHEVKFIDFEGAYERNVDKPINLFTPGFAKYERIERDETDYHDDFYALGCILAGMFIPNTTLLQLNDQFVSNLLEDIHLDYGLPTRFIRIVKTLLTEQNLNLNTLKDELLSIDLSAMHAFEFNFKSNKVKIEKHAAECLVGIHQYNQQNLEPKSELRILPTGPQMSDIFAMDKGILGVAYSWAKTGQELPQELMDWIKDKLKEKSGGKLPGLMNGLSGTAWALDSIGFEEDAKHALKQALHHPNLFQKMNLGYGAAGFGLTLLHFWNRYANESYLKQATKIADVLCDTAYQSNRGLCWEESDDDNGISLGLLEGASGIALFLLYMHKVTGQQRYLETAEKGLQFDLSFEKSARGSIGFPRVSGDNIVYPYLAFGSAGIASVVLRFYQVTKKADYLDFLGRVKADITHKYAINPGFSTGLTGLGVYLLDAYQILNDKSYLTLTYQVVDGLRMFEVDRDNGIVFPDSNRMKVCTDINDGSGGVALFLHRFIHNLPNNTFMLDELIQK